VHDVSSTIENDIHRLELGLRQLKIQYDMFFAGSLPRQPFELRGEVERLIKRNSNATIRKYAHRFHFNSLVSRFNALSELWGKTIRAMEEGDRPVHGVTAPSEEPDGMLVTFRIQNPLEEERALRKLHERFLEERRRAQMTNGRLTFESFLRGITAQGRKLQERSGCEEIELRLVVVEDSVQVKARPKKK
jgi:hypothetical protein